MRGQTNWERYARRKLKNPRFRAAADAQLTVLRLAWRSRNFGRAGGSRKHSSRRCSGRPPRPFPGSRTGPTSRSRPSRGSPRRCGLARTSACGLSHSPLASNLPDRPRAPIADRVAATTGATRQIAGGSPLLQDDYRHRIAEDTDGLAGRGEADHPDLVGAGRGGWAEHDREARRGHHDPPAGASEAVSWVEPRPVRVGELPGSVCSNPYCTDPTIPVQPMVTGIAGSRAGRHPWAWPVIVAHMRVPA